MVLPLLVALIGMSFDHARGDITDKGAVRLGAKAVSAKVVLGGSVKVPLIGIRTTSTERVSFGITKPPEHGELGEIMLDSVDTTRGWVVYRPNADAKPGVDSFTYTAKFKGKFTSLSAKATIKLEDPEPLLAVEPSLIFGRVEVGKSATLPLRILNRGTQAFRSSLQLPAPWSIPLDQRQLFVEPGETAVVDIVFTPVDEQPAKYLLPLQVSSPNGSVEFSGVGFAPFRMPVGTLDLDWDESTAKRAGKMPLANVTDTPLQLKVSAEPPLRVERLITLEPKQAFDLPLVLDGIERYRGKLVVESEHYQTDIAIVAEATPAAVEVVSPDVRDFSFELMDTDTPPVYEVVVRNNGGKPAFIYGATSRPFKVIEGGEPTELASGDEMSITFSMDASEVGSFARQLVIEGTRSQVAFELSATVTRDTYREKAKVHLPDLIPLISPHEEKRLRLVPNQIVWNVGLNNTRRIYNDEVPTVGTVYLEEQTSRKLVLSWDHPGAADLDYILEFEVYEGEEGKVPQPVWYQAEAKHVKLVKDDKTATLTLKKLRPDRQFRIRILTIDANGHSSRPSRAERVYTLPAKGLPAWLLLPVLVVLGCAGFYFWRRRQYG